MREPERPGPGRSTAEAALNDVKREVARRNQEAQKAGSKLRAQREERLRALRREWDRR